MMAASNQCGLCTAKASWVCVCRASPLRLCPRCLGTHNSQNQSEVHSLLPISASEYVQRAGYLQRLRLRREQQAAAQRELWDNVRRLDFCESVFRARIEEALEDLRLYRDVTVQLLADYRSKLVQRVNTAVKEASEHIFEEDYQAKDYLVAGLLDYAPGKLALFSYELTEDGKLIPKLSLSPSQNAPSTEPSNLTSTQSSSRPLSPLPANPTTDPLPLVVTTPAKLPKRRVATERKNPFFEADQRKRGSCSVERNLAALMTPRSPDPHTLQSAWRQNGSDAQLPEDTVLDVSTLRVTESVHSPLPLSLTPQGLSLLQLTDPPLISQVSLPATLRFSALSAIASFEHGDLLICGGTESASAALVHSSTVSALSSMHESRGAHSAVTCGAAVYVFGGRSGNSALRSAERYHACVWESLPAMTQCRSFFTATVSQASIYLLGGVDTTSCELFSTVTCKYTLLRWELQAAAHSVSVAIGENLLVLQPGRVSRLRADHWESISIPSLARYHVLRSPWSNHAPVAVGQDLLLCCGDSLLRVDMAEWTAYTYR